MNKKYHTVKAFTLLETLASIAIISLVIVGPLSVLSSSSSYARQTKDTIIATYLAEEAIELLQNQYDSIYIYCNKNPTATDPGSLCEPASATETTRGQSAWRVFKERLSYSPGQPSCFKDENPIGCTYNATAMTGDITLTPPTRYQAGGGECPRLLKVSKQVMTRGTGATGPNLPPLFITRSSYVCSGGNISPDGVVDTSKSFSRSVSVEHLPTFETAPLKEEQYNDDLRITSEVTFRSINGRSNTLRVTRFMHARL